MRSYPSNSPEAAARIVALALLADGHLSQTEYAALGRHEASRLLGLQDNAMECVVQHLAEDLMAFGAASWGGSASLLDEDSFRSVLREVSDPSLRRVVLEICAAVTSADQHRCENEHGLLEFARKTWGYTAASSALVH